jgi:hypothetical protein
MNNGMSKMNAPDTPERERQYRAHSAALPAKVLGTVWKPFFQNGFPRI